MQTQSLALTILGTIIGQEFGEGKSCTITIFGGYNYGLCTYYGACRIKNKDFMYQGGCGEISKWGEKQIKRRSNVCKIWDKSEVAIHAGQCSKEGFCVSDEFSDKNNPECAAYTMFGGNVTVPRSFTLENKKLQRKKKFLENVFFFLGGLGNALNYANTVYPSSYA